ncbi:PilZ domain-containing protein [Litchfieldella rifensis]|uniref:PilZ domain-containing protein n=1 Tax=Litchfieldella rifensis TaxID=762643 RepID=A0ABV7LL67_9GAMM
MSDHYSNTDGVNRTEPTLGRGRRTLATPHHASPHEAERGVGDHAHRPTPEHGLRGGPEHGHEPDYRRRPAPSSPGGQHPASRPADDKLVHERRDERRHVRVTPPFHVKLADGRVLTGADVSLGGFALYSDAPMQPGSVVSASLLLEAGAAELNVPLDARCVRCTPVEEGKRTYKVAFEITTIEPPQRELLQRVIRAYLSGRYATIDTLVDIEDPQTPRKRRPRNGAPPSNTRPPKPLGRYVALFMAAGILALVAAATAYRNFMLIEPSFAAVTAPRIDIRAPGSGILEEHDLQAGDSVERDQYLTSVKNSDLESELILAKASHRFNDQLIKNLQESLDSGGTEQVSLVNSTQPQSGDTVSFETASPEIARARIEQFETARDYENSRISALESRMAMNDITSPCDCLVAWALSSADGTYINESERIMTLIRTHEDDVLVEALVHMRDIARIEPDQMAYIALPHASEPIRAKVRSVALDVERQPRAGFPRWVRQQQNVASVLLVPETTLPAEAVGQPVDVRFTEAPLLGATAEWIWQGGRAVAQFVGQVFHVATGGHEETG